MVTGWRARQSAGFPPASACAVVAHGHRSQIRRIRHSTPGFARDATRGRHSRWGRWRNPDKSQNGARSPRASAGPRNRRLRATATVATESEGETTSARVDGSRRTAGGMRPCARAGIAKPSPRGRRACRLAIGRRFRTVPMARASPAAKRGTRRPGRACSPPCTRCRGATATASAPRGTARTSASTSSTRTAAPPPVVRQAAALTGRPRGRPVANAACGVRAGRSRRRSGRPAHARSRSNPSARSSIRSSGSSSPIANRRHGPPGFHAVAVRTRSGHVGITMLS